MTREHDHDLQLDIEIDPELEAAARRQLHRLAAAIEVDAGSDVDSDTDTVDGDLVAVGTSRDSKAPDADEPRRRSRIGLLAAATLLVVAVGAAAVLAVIITGDDQADDVAADDPDGSATTDALGPPGGEPVPTELPAWLEGPWLAENDQPMPTDGRGPTLSIFQGAEHCDWQQVTAATMTWPPGFLPEPHPIDRYFVRDPAGVLGPEFGVHGEFDGDATMPDDARATGLHNDETRLWVADSDPSSLYVRRSDGTVERWPRADAAPVCM